MPEGTPVVEPAIEPVTPPVEPEKTYTQAEVNAAAASARKADKDALKAGEAAIAKLAELEAAKLTDDEKKDKRIADAEARAKTAETERDSAKLDSLKASIGAELNIPASLRSRLIGTTEEEIRADAVLVAADSHVEPPKTPIGGGGRPAGASTTDEARVAAMRAAARLK